MWGKLLGITSPESPGDRSGWAIAKAKSDISEEAKRRSLCQTEGCGHRKSGHTSSRGMCHARPLIDGKLVHCKCEKFTEAGE